jgi:hypothetical protein
MDTVRNLRSSPALGESKLIPDSSTTIQATRTSVTIRCPKIVLEIYSNTIKTELPNNYALARIISSSAYLKVDMQANETNAELKFRSLSVYDTRVHTNSVFRDIMVPMTEVDDQFLMTVKMNGIFCTNARLQLRLFNNN